MDKDVPRRLDDWVISQALMKGMNQRAALLAGHAALMRQQGLTEAEWRRELIAHAAYIGGLLEALVADVDSLREAGLWPWEEAPSNADAKAVQGACNAAADAAEEADCRRLLAELGEPDGGA